MQPAVQLLGDLRDQVGADHGAVRLVQVPARRAGPPGRAGPGRRRRARARQQGGADTARRRRCRTTARPPSRPRRPRSTRPRPRRAPPRAGCRARSSARRAAPASAAATAQDSGGEYASGSKIRPRPPRRARVDEHRVVPGGVHLRDVRLAHLDQVGEPQRLGVGPRHRRTSAGRGPRPAPGSRRGPARSRRRRSRSTGRRPSVTPSAANRSGAVRRHARPGRLLDAVRREEHPLRVLGPELRHRPLPQPGLPERRRHQRRPGARGAAGWRRRVRRRGRCRAPRRGGRGPRG